MQEDVNYILKDTEISEGITLCEMKVLSLLKSAEILASNQEAIRTSLALYTLAVEEFGKLLLSNRCLSIEGKYLVPKDLFQGNRAHQNKFKEAMADLPPPCTDLLRSIRVPYNASQQYTAIPNPDQKGKKQTVLIPARTSGLFTDTTRQDNVKPIELGERFDVFYVNWDDKEHQWVDGWLYQDQLCYESVPDPSALDAAISEFQEASPNQTGHLVKTSKPVLTKRTHGTKNKGLMQSTLRDDRSSPPV